MNDQIEINGIACRCRIGVPAAERKTRQNILVDVGVDSDCQKAGRSDDFRHALDYQALETAVRRAAESGEHKLVECLAEKIAAAVLAFGARVRAVAVAVHKSPAAMPRTREVVVRITRKKP